jgi:hypothetical protein
VCDQLHFDMCKEMGVKLDKNTCMATYQNHSQQVQTDRTIPNSKPDTLMGDNEEGNMYINIRCNFWRQKYDQEKS